MKYYKGHKGYDSAKTTEWCSEGKDIGGRNNCSSDKECLENGRKLCDGNPGCFGIAWYEHRLAQPLKMCSSTKMSPKTDGWRTLMKSRVFNSYLLDGQKVITLKLIICSFGLSKFNTYYFSYQFQYSVRLMPIVLVFKCVVITVYAVGIKCCTWFIINRKIQVKCRKLSNCLQHTFCLTEYISLLIVSLFVSS